MPRLTLSPEARRELTLCALSGVPKKELAKRYGISLQRVYQLEGEARRDAKAEYEYWRAVQETMHSDFRPGP